MVMPNKQLFSQQYIIDQTTRVKGAYSNLWLEQIGPNGNLMANEVMKDSQSWTIQKCAPEAPAAPASPAASKAQHGSVRQSNGFYLSDAKAEEEDNSEFASDVNMNVQQESENVYKMRLHKKGYMSANEFDFDLK